MTLEAVLLYQAPGVLLGFLLGLSLAIFFSKRRQSDEEGSGGDGNKNYAKSTLEIIKSRRTITPKDFNGQSLSQEEIDQLMDAANWAPTHKKTEPWRYSIYVGPAAILDYLDFIDNWYRDHAESIPEKEMEEFRKKLDGIRREWPDKVSHLVVIGMKRGEGLPEWEELCAVAMSVQNIHLLTAAMPDVAGFWSSHTWCKYARESPEMRQFVGLGNEPGNRVLGAFVLGRVDREKRGKFRSTREDIKKKLHWHF